MEDTFTHAYFDLKWTSEAVYNIMDNAIKYTETGGSMNIKVMAYDLFCRIDITDSGIGIAEEEQGKIFTRFYRSPTVNSQEGVGIGLFLAKEIIAAEENVYGSIESSGIKEALRERRYCCSCLRWCESGGGKR
ncbi:signal transduction histidine kinase [Paenibacillus polymyxa]|nr:signal transduction histidine kinase [Paenibacillus polymyxa]